MKWGGPVKMDDFMKTATLAKCRGIAKPLEDGKWMLIYGPAMKGDSYDQMG